MAPIVPLVPMDHQFDESYLFVYIGHVWVTGIRVTGKAVMTGMTVITKMSSITRMTGITGITRITVG